MLMAQQRYSKSMKVLLLKNFLTFVLTLFAIGIPRATANPPPIPAPILPPGKVSPEPPPTATGRELDDNHLMATPIPTNRAEFERARMYPYRQALSVRVGPVGSTDRELGSTMLFGVQYLWPRYASPHAEFGADVVVGLGGHLNAGVRHIYRERQFLRPYLLWGLTHEVSPSAGYATFLSSRNYYLRAGAGFEMVHRLPRSLKIDFELLSGTKKHMILMGLGYSWGW
jgi:hypothetical protein